MDAIIDSPEARAVVRSLPAELLYTTIQEVGLADSTELVQLASPAQFRTFVDLAAWKRDQIEPHAVLTWLRAARGEETEEFLRKLHRVDLEMLEYMLREFTQIHDLEENPDVNPEGVTMEMPEGRYLIEFKVEGVEQAALRAIINDLIAENPFEMARLLEAIRKAFSTFTDAIERTQRSLQAAQNNLDDASRRSRSIEKELQLVESVNSPALTDT